MATEATAPIVRLENVRVHPNADKLEICDVLGYQMCIPKDRYSSGDVAVYFPADVLIPRDWADKFGVTQFLRGKENDRVSRIRLRGEPSFGLVVSTDYLEREDFTVGENVAEFFGIKKYVPPIRPTAGDAAEHDDVIDPLFTRYTDIENGRIFTEVLREGEEIIVTEKIHGTNCRLGMIAGQEVAGSMGLRRKRPEDDKMSVNTYWYPWTTEPVHDLIHHLAADHNQVLLYGEIFGGSIQSLHYGIAKGKGVGFRAFDLFIDGKYLGWDPFVELCEKFAVPTVPVLYRGSYTMDKMKELADGPTKVDGDNIREGIVAKPPTERTDPAIGRVVLKYIGTEYSLGRHSDYTDV